jgi:hypothetical protein
MNDFTIVPYCKIDGVRNYSDTFIMDLYTRMQNDGTARSVFMGSSVNNRSSFLSMAKDKGCFLYILYAGDDLAGVVWLNRQQYRWAQFHFCTFKEVWGRKTVALGKYVLHKLINMGNGEEFFFDMFVGIIPSSNRVGLSYVQKCGGVVSGTLPYGVFNPSTGKSEEATIITLTREGLE